MDVETIKLKPCPFCGGAAGIHEGPSEPWIFCEDCGVGFEGQLGLLPALWNRRTDRQERIDELEYELEVAIEQRDQAVQAAGVAREERDAWKESWYFVRSQRDELNYLASDRLIQRDLWQRRALYARRAYHEQKRRRRELAYYIRRVHVLALRMNEWFGNHPQWDLHYMPSWYPAFRKLLVERVPDGDPAAKEGTE
ncbi:MAG: Lar family restriction alleviation protein [Chloroflexota bacterium]